jgi:hypothetical protein
MNESVTVYTSIVGSRDQLREEQNPEGALFVAYVDQSFRSKIWSERPAYSGFVSKRRNARIPKILAHQFIKTAFSVWIDGSVALKVPARLLVDEWLHDFDLAVFSHPKRKCTYEEARECASRRLDDPELLAEQTGAYQSSGFAEGLGLAETGIVVRRHTEKVEIFNNHWWSEFCRYSVRDQVAFMYSASQVGVKLNLLQGDLRHHPYFDILRRPAECEPNRNESRL